MSHIRRSRVSWTIDLWLCTPHPPPPHTHAPYWLSILTLDWYSSWCHFNINSGTEYPTYPERYTAGSAESNRIINWFVLTRTSVSPFLSKITPNSITWWALFLCSAYHTESCKPQTAPSQCIHSSFRIKLMLQRIQRFAGRLRDCT